MVDQLRREEEVVGARVVRLICGREVGVRVRVGRGRLVVGWRGVVRRGLESEIELVFLDEGSESEMHAWS